MAGWKNRTAEVLDVLTTLFWSSGASCHVLATRLVYSKNKANGLVAGLLKEGLLFEAGLQDSSGGWRAETLQVSRSLGVLIGIDLGATGMQLAIMQPDLTALARHRDAMDVRSGPGVVLARLRTVNGPTCRSRNWQRMACSALPSAITWSFRRSAI